MKHLSKIKIWLTVIIGIIVLNSVIFESLLAQTSPSPYDKGNLSVYEVEKLYHTRINDLFNKKIQLLTQGDKGPGIPQPPQGDNCQENNYSTYCLAIATAKEYEQFKAALLKKKQTIKIDTEEPVTLEKATLEAAAQASEIDNELRRSQKALDTALATYNELRISYAMHFQYQELIKNLTKYSKKLSEYRQEVEKLPGKFIDATTTECT